MQRIILMCIEQDFFLFMYSLIRKNDLKDIKKNLKLFVQKKLLKIR